MDIKNIVLGEGLGQIKFGMTRDQVKAILGEPDDVDSYEDMDIEDDGSESWHYDELELSLSFDEEEDWRLVTIAVSAASYLFDGKEVIGMEKEAFLNQVDSLNIGESETEDWSSEEMPNHELVSYGDVQANFWFEDGTLTEIQWGPFFEDEDNIKWPA